MMSTKPYRSFDSSDDYRREELIRTIEYAVEQLSTAELEAVYYDLLTKDYIR